MRSRISQGAGTDAARVKAFLADRDFFTLWKNADPGIPILKEAKAALEIIPDEDGPAPIEPAAKTES